MQLGRDRFPRFDHKRKRKSFPFVSIEESRRQNHFWIIGKTGQGKSSFLQNAIQQDIRAGNGLALGSGIFLQGNNTIFFQPAAGQTQTVADVITDQNGSLGSEGSGALTLNGAGTLVLSAVDTYTGPTTVTVGTLAVTGSIANSIATVSGICGIDFTRSTTIGLGSVFRER